jgi:hypothetical protein
MDDAAKAREAVAAAAHPEDGPAIVEPVITEETLKAVEELVEQEDGAISRSADGGAGCSPGSASR